MELLNETNNKIKVDHPHKTPIRAWYGKIKYKFEFRALALILCVRNFLYFQTKMSVSKCDFTEWVKKLKKIYEKYAKEECKTTFHGSNESVGFHS